MAFHPLLTISLTFASLEIQADPNLQPLFQYFRHEWLTVVPPAMWNVYGECLRTNNGCEGWHLRFNNAVNTHHPNIWRFLQCLLEEQAATELMRQQMISGRITHRRTKVHQYPDADFQVERPIRSWRH